MQKTNFFSILLLTILLSGCSSGTTKYTGVQFPATSDSKIAFQEQTIPTNCSAFSHLMMQSKTNSSGQDIASAMHREAQEKGANLILLGLAREMGGKVKVDRFDYYGPEYAYNFYTTWMGWKFGFEEWHNAGNFVGLGTDNWGNSEISFEHTLLIQAVFLRCGEEH